MNNIKTPQLIHYFGLLLLAAIWGSAFIAVEMALTTYDPFIIAFFRIFFATLFLLAVMRVKQLHFPRDSKSWTILICVGILNNALPFFLISWGQQYISASTAAIMLAVGPFIALILSHYITHDEKFTLLKLIGVILGFLGVFILLGHDFLNQRHDSLKGELAMLGATLGYIGSGLLLRRVSYLPTVVCSSSMFLTATLSMLPFLFLYDINSHTILNFSLISVVYLAIFPTALASLIRVQLVQNVGVQFMSQVSYLIPIFAIFWSWVFFKKLPSTSAWLALVLILSGLFIRKLEKK
ncbi:DMT family transporter [Candidatus Marinarcus aquaticus]|uniref:EamA domain-containing protein n=1 Tax=Candidatus Marinarcus aquaticus TaxID=2044504 RepID=A0A4V1LPD3_9BACT|nr:DMT family transporter [Candidatus Marinarcus aquaticus]RXJ60798.1 hypothetical protein CRV04_01935 [Candidatus Marinarcus aquaticus]